MDSVNPFFTLNPEKAIELKLKEWLARVFIKGTFSSATDGVYPVMRKLINENMGRFPLQEIIVHYKGKKRSISFTEDDIENILDYEYGKKHKKIFSALALLYPSLNRNFKYHQDHIHPKSFFSPKKLVKIGLTEKEIKAFQARFNKLPNLQFLEAFQNIEKSNNPFKDWLEEVYHKKNTEMHF